MQQIVICLFHSSQKILWKDVILVRHWNNFCIRPQKQCQSLSKIQMMHYRKIYCMHLTSLSTFQNMRKHIINLNSFIICITNVQWNRFECMIQAISIKLSVQLLILNYNYVSNVFYLSRFIAQNVIKACIDRRILNNDRFLHFHSQSAN